MLYKATVAVCSDIHTKHSTQSEHYVAILNVKPDGMKRKTTGFKSLTVPVNGRLDTQGLILQCFVRSAVSFAKEAPCKACLRIDMTRDRTNSFSPSSGNSTTSSYASSHQMAGET
jgi:hypothetical protein